VAIDSTAVPAPDPAPVPADPPRFNAVAMRSTACSVVAVRAAADRLDMHFGVRQVDPEGGAGSAGAQRVLAAHRIGLTRDAAVHLEELLTRVLDPAARPGAGAPGTEGPAAP
jgi:hypothetical protein